MAARSAAILRELPFAECEYVFFIEGIDKAFTTDNSGALHGSGSGSWIYVSQQELKAARECVDREVMPGLVINEVCIGEIEWETGVLEKNTVNFKIMDLDDRLATLFQVEGIEYDRIALGDFPVAIDTNLGTSYGSTDGSTVNPRGKWIDIERIGPSGQRAVFPPVPVASSFAQDWVAYNHNYQTKDGMPNAPVRLSSAPLIFEGRKVALYRIYKDPDSNAGDYTDWNTWLEAHNADDLVWWGTLRGPGRQSGEKEWTISCFGPESWLSKKVGWLLPDVERTITPNSISLQTDELKFGLIFRQHRTVADATIAGLRTTIDIESSDMYSTLSSSFDSVEDLRLEIDRYIQDVATGTTTYSLGANITAGLTADQHDCTLTMGANGHITITNKFHSMTAHLCLSKAVWSILGYSTEQSGEPEDSEYYCSFKKELQFADLGSFFEDADPALYRRMVIKSVARGEEEDFVTNGASSNYGLPKVYKPLNPFGVGVLLAAGGGVFGVNGSDVFESQPTLMPTQEGFDAVAADVTAPVMFSGKIRYKGSDDEQDIQQVALVSWNEDSPGEINVETSFYVEKFMTPWTAGLKNTNRLKADWKFTSGQIKMRPFNSYITYQNVYADNVLAIMMQLLFSTGEGTGYDGLVGTSTTLDEGDNSPAGSPPEYADCHRHDMGIALPKKMSAAWEDFLFEFNRLPGGSNGPMCRGRLIFSGPMDSFDILRSITEPRRMYWSLNGKIFGLRHMRKFGSGDVDVTVTENDLHGEPGDPSSARLEQSFMDTGKIDKVKIDYGNDPRDNSTVGTLEFIINDNSSRFRPFTRTLELKDITLQDVKSDSIKSWNQDFINFYSKEVAPFMNLPHSLVTMKVARIKGQDIMPGSVISITNSWLQNLNGSYGVTAGTAFVTKVTWDFEEESYEVECVLMGSQAGVPKYFGPIAKIRGIDGATVYLEDNYFGVQQSATFYDCEQFGIPSWVDTNDYTHAAVTIMLNYGDTIGPYTVSSVDTATNSITLTTSPTGYLRDEHKFIYLAPYASQSSTSWAKAYGSVVTLPNGTFDSAVQGWRLI